MGKRPTGPLDKTVECLRCDRDKNQTNNQRHDGRARIRQSTVVSQMVEDADASDVHHGGLGEEETYGFESVTLSDTAVAKKLKKRKLT